MSSFTHNTTNKFKGKMGHYMLKSLFWENHAYLNFRGSEIEPLYTLKDNDHTVEIEAVQPDGSVRQTRKTYPSLYKLYMQEEDLTEYDFAKKHLDSWAHWQLLQSKDWFQEYILRWRTELELKLRSEAMKAIIDEARVGGRNSYDAKKYILAKGWIDKTAEPSRRGRPSKAEMEARMKETMLSDKQIDEDIKRLNLN